MMRGSVSLTGKTWLAIIEGYLNADIEIRLCRQWRSYISTVWDEFCPLS